MNCTIEKPVTRSKECRACLGPHDDEIHDATVALHEWFRRYITRHMVDAIELQQAS
jgi:hypothetical protein